MEKQKTLRQQIEEYMDGKYEGRDFKTQCDAGWYDWFCKTESLSNKTKNLYSKVIAIKESNKIDIDKTYVFFKNNCPCSGGLYDDFRICDINSGNVIYTVIPKRKNNNNGDSKGEVYGAENGFSEPLVEGCWREIKKWFLQQI